MICMKCLKELTKCLRLKVSCWMQHWLLLSLSINVPLFQFLGTWNGKRFFKVQCKESLEFFTMEVVSKQSITDSKSTAMQFGTVAESLPNWGLPFCMELRFVFETLNKRYYVLDYAGEANLADLMKDGLPEPTACTVHVFYSINTYLL